MKKFVLSTEYVMLDEYIANGAIKTCATKKEVQKYAKSIGWQIKYVIKVRRRFEDVWIVAQPTQPELIGNLAFDVMRCPTGQYTTINGAKQMIVLTVKKLV